LKVFAFGVESNSQLNAHLETWGAKAPPRLERRGNQKDLDRFVLRLFLLKVENEKVFGFPLEVYEDENPDFVIVGEKSKVGVEITEACDPDEQSEWTRDARLVEQSGQPLVRSVDLMEPNRGNKLRDIVQRSVDRKTNKVSDDCSALVIYLNTSSAGYLDCRWHREALATIKIPIGKIDNVWVVNGEDLIEIGKGT